jgi:predicted Zn-dependent protease with MMP-like domain
MVRPMARQDRLQQHLERGFACLDDGDLDGAAAALDRARRIDRRHPDVLGLEGSIAASRGDGDAALAAFEQMAVVAPDDAMPLINVAMVHLHSRDDAETALEWVDRGLELAEDDDALTQGITLKAEALIALGGDANLAVARDVLGELATSVIDDDHVLDLAELWLDAGDPARAARLAERATKVDGDPALVADAYHLLGVIHDTRGDAAARTRAWLETKRLDLAAAAPAWSLAPDAFDQLAHAALEELPPRARELLGNTPVLVELAPSDELVEDGIDPRLLGLFSGPALPDHAHVGGGPELTTIHLFQRNLEASTADADDLAEQIRITVLHETAHFFGLEEDDLEKLGLD